MSKLGCALVLGALGLAACGGGSTPAPPIPTAAPQSAVLFSWTPEGMSVNLPPYTISLSSTGTATKASNGAFSTVSVPDALTTQVFADVKAAQPLNALPFGGYPDFPSITVNAQGLTSPNIDPGANAQEDALLTDFFNLGKLFP